MPRNHIHIKVYMTEEQKKRITEFAVMHELSTSQLLLSVMNQYIEDFNK